MKRKGKADHEEQHPHTRSTSVCRTLPSKLVLLIVLICATRPVSPHVISTSHVFYRNQSPYVINENIEVTRDGQVRIEPGVELRFAAGTGVVVRGGSLIAAVSPCLFSPTEYHLLPIHHYVTDVLTGMHD